MDFGEDRAQKANLAVTPLLSGKRPEAKLGVNLESPLLALWRHCVIYLLDFDPMWNACRLSSKSVFCRLTALASAWFFAHKAARQGDPAGTRAANMD